MAHAFVKIKKGMLNGCERLRSEETPHGRIALANNVQQLETLRHGVAVLLGALVGKVGVSSLFEGLAIFAVSSALVTPAIFALTTAVKTERPLREFYPSHLTLFKTGLSTGVMSFVLTWVLVYNFIFIY